MQSSEKLEEATELARNLHFGRFPEEYDYISDSIEDARQRRLGINPMSDEYILEVNIRRENLGVSPLLENGTFDSNETRELMLNKAWAILKNENK